jgi:hypothetical protein
VESKRSADFPPAHRVGELLHVVASALPEIPFGDVHASEIHRITDLTVENDAPLEAPLELCARTVGTRGLTANRNLVVIQCQLTNQLGDCVAAFSVETEAEAPVELTALEGMPHRTATSEPDLECIDNIPV